MMNKTKRNIIRNIMVIFVLMVMYLAFKEPLDAKASYHLRTGISLEPATGNADVASMPKCFREYYSHQNPYFLITVGTDVYLKRATLYLYNSGEVKMYSKTILPQKDYFRYTSIVPGRLEAGNYYYEWEIVYSTGSSTNSNNTLQGGKVSFKVTDLTYNISYNANGGSGAPSSQTKYYDKWLTLSSQKPIRTGYTFKGWSTSSTATKASYQPGDNYTSNSDATLYAVWERTQYNISYNANGGSGAPSAQSKYHGSTLTLRSAKPTRTGYIFKGWSTSSTATKASYQPGDNYTSNSNVTLYAVWEKIQYNISYDANGGSGAPSDQSKYYGSTLTLRSAKPTRTGYIFKGWSTSSTATKASYQPGDNYTSNSNVTLYAVWEKIQYNISYDANGGSGAPSDQSKYYDSTLTLRSGKPTREGYIFKGWSTRSTALSADYQPGASYSSNSNLTLYAVWEQIKCYVYYNANGGSGAPFEQWKYYDSTLVLRSGTPIRVGYTFKGWSTSSTATSASYMPGSTYTANRDMTLYAVWKAMPTVTPTPRPGSSINQGTQVTSQPSSLSSGTGLYTPASAGNNKKKAAKLKIGSIVVKNSLVCKVISLTGKKGKLKVIRLNSNKLKKVIIPQKIKINGVNFAVTVIGKNVFNKKCKRLKVIFIKSTELTKFEKNKISKKCKIIVPKSKVKKYTKLIKKL